MSKCAKIKKSKKSKLLTTLLCTGTMTLLVAMPQTVLAGETAGPVGTRGTPLEDVGYNSENDGYVIADNSIINSIVCGQGTNSSATGGDFAIRATGVKAINSSESLHIGNNVTIKSILKTDTAIASGYTDFYLTGYGINFSSVSVEPPQEKPKLIIGNGLNLSVEAIDVYMSPTASSSNTWLYGINVNGDLILGDGARINVTDNISRNYGDMYHAVTGIYCDTSTLGNDNRITIIGNSTALDKQHLYIYGIDSESDLRTGQNNVFSIEGNIVAGDILAKGIYRSSGGNITTGDNNTVTVKAMTTNTGVDEADFELYGVNAETFYAGINGSFGKNFTVAIDARMEKDTAKVSANIYGIRFTVNPPSSESQISFADGLNIDIKAVAKSGANTNGDFNVWGIWGDNNDWDTEWLKMTLENSARIKVASTTDCAADNGDGTHAHIAGGIKLQNGYMEANGPLTIDVSIGGGTKDVIAYGISSVSTEFGYSGSKVFINGPLTITTKAIGAISRNVALLAAQDGEITVKGDNDVRLIGDIVATYDDSETALTGPPEEADRSWIDGARINLTLNTADSYLRGLLSAIQSGTSSGTFNTVEFNLSNGARWQPTGNGDAQGKIAIGDNVNINLGDNGIIDLAWWNNQNDILNPISKFRTLELSGHYTNFQNGGGVIRVNSDTANGLADKVSVIAADVDSEEGIPEPGNGTPGGSGTLYIEVAHDKSFNTSLPTDSSYIIYAPADNKPTVLEIIGYRNDFLHGITLVTGRQSAMDSPLERYLVSPKIEHYQKQADDGSNTTSDYYKIGSIEYIPDGPSEPVLVAEEAQMALYNLWKIDTSNLMRRMGELRYNSETPSGIWARTYNGKLKSRDSYSHSFNQKYNGVQIGWDNKHIRDTNVYYTGVMFNYLKSSAYYANGDGDLSSYGLGVYLTWFNEKGHYFDAVVKANRLKNKYDLIDANADNQHAEYHTWGIGMSTEYGYRKNFANGSFFEPQLQFDLGSVQAVDYHISNGTGISQGSINSAIGRIGLLFGRKIDKKNLKGNIYSRISVLHEFGGNGDLTAYYGANSLDVQTPDKNNTWCEFNLGANIDMGQNTSSYFELVKTVGGNTRLDWQLSAGVRWNW